MRLGLHSWTYSTPPDPAEIPPTLAEQVLPRLAGVGGSP
jgi:hypothetical protein